MFKISATLFSCILFFSVCSQTGSKLSMNKNDSINQTPKKIVLIFDLTNSLGTKNFTEGKVSFKYTPKLSYINEYYSEIFLGSKKSDTVTIISDFDILLKFSSIPAYDFLISPTDTFIIENKEDVLTCRSLTKKSERYDFVFSQEVEHYIINKTSNKIFNVTSNNIKENEKLFNQLKLQYTQRKFFLDSIYQKNQISAKYFEFYKEKIKFDFLSLCLLKEFRLFSNTELQYLLTAAAIRRDSLIYHHFYQNFLSHYLYSYTLNRPPHFTVCITTTLTY